MDALALLETVALALTAVLSIAAFRVDAALATADLEASDSACG